MGLCFHIKKCRKGQEPGRIKMSGIWWCDLEQKYFTLTKVPGRLLESQSADGDNTYKVNDPQRTGDRLAT
jgi:hypothetical protein